MKWSILMITKQSRTVLRNRLLKILEPQLAKYKQDVEFLMRVYDPALSVGQQCQMLIDEAKGDYVSFVDDDDLVSVNYIEKIFPLLGTADTVGFKMLRYATNQPAKVYTYKFGGGIGRPDAPCMPFYAQTPVRTELVRQVRVEGAREHDVRWFKKMVDLKIVKSGSFVDDVLYFYLSSPEGHYAEEPQ
jgi:hypothetical protein